MDGPGPLGLVILPPAKQGIVWVNKMPGLVVSKTRLIDIAPAAPEYDQPRNPPLEVSGLARRLNDRQWLTNPFLGEGIKAGLNDFASRDNRLRPRGLDVDSW
jgi:hypothetical protein